MRLIYTLLAVLIFTSCSKKDALVSGNPNPAPAADATQVINATINTDFTYQLPLTSPDMQIHKQAAHFALSAIGVDSKNGMTVYKYLPAKGFTGSDEVTLKETTTYTSYSEGEGCRDMNSPQNVTKTTFVKIRFTVN
jgi:hypothetical protein